jgi:hypothetical protein
MKPEGTMFSGITQVFIAAYKNRRLTLPADGEVVEIFYDPPLEESVASKLPLTEQLRYLLIFIFFIFYQFKLSNFYNKW